MVNLIIPGAPKAGTTSITAFLTQREGIFIPGIKEPRFFIKDQLQRLSEQDPLKKYFLKKSILDWQHYEQLYSNNEAYNIDASVQYLYYHKTAIPAIKAHLQDPLIFIILRDPVKRAFSNYNFNIKSERSATFIEAIQEELNGKREDLNSFYHYYKQSLYYEPVKSFMENFSNVKVLFYEDFEKDNLAFINSVLNLLQLPPFKELPKLQQLNTSSELTALGNVLVGKYSLYNIVNRTLLPLFFSRGQLFQLKLKLLAQFAKKPAGKTALSQEDKQFLTDLFKEDAAKLKALLQLQTLPWKGYSNVLSKVK